MNYSSPENTNYMYLRNKDNRSGASLDVGGRRGYYVQEAIARGGSKDARLGLQYNSTSIPYIYKVGARGAPQQAKPNPGPGRRAGDNLFNLNASFGKYSRHSGINKAGGPGYVSNQYHYKNAYMQNASFMESQASASYQTAGTGHNFSPKNQKATMMQLTGLGGPIAG